METISHEGIQSMQIEPPIASDFSKSITENDEEEKIAEEMEEVMKGLKEVISEEGAKRKLEETMDDDATAGMNGDTGSGVDEEAKLDESLEGPTPAKKALLEINVRKLLPDLEKHWKAVEEDPSDFTAWTYLLQYVDQENELLAARDAYDGFLARYPYCYGYWKKYADFEKRKGSAEDCEKVFRRGLKAIPLSVDLWIHYLNYVKATHEHDQEYIREQFNEAVRCVGMEFRSDKLWEHYIQYEKEGNNLKHLLAIYDQLLATPTQAYVQHFHSCLELANAHPPEDLLSPEEYIDIRNAVEIAAAAPDSAEGEEPVPPADLTDADKEVKIRQKLIERRTEVHKKTEAEVTARWAFEEAIKRPYFHVKPLEKGQLKMWKEYLDFEIEKGDEKRIFILFERCLIACALYEEYWIKYVKFLESQPVVNIERLRDVFNRACTIHHSGKPFINLHWAAFEEAQGNLEQASEILEKLEKVIPSSLPLYFRRINLERRRGNVQASLDLFEKFIADEKNKPYVGHVKIKYARFVNRLLNDYERAKQILKEAIGQDESSRAKTIMALIDLALQRDPIDYDTVVSCFDEALASGISNEQKVTFAHRKMEFLEDYGHDVLSAEKAQEELQSIAKQLREKKGETGRDELNPPKATNGGTYSSTNTSSSYSHGGSGSGHHGSSSGSGQGSGQYNQYGQYSNWNYNQSAGYGYNQGYSAYGGYYG